MSQQRTWRQRRQDSFQHRLLIEAWSTLWKEKENVTWSRHHEDGHIAAAEARYQAARAVWDAAVEKWLSYCRQSGADGNVVEVHHP